MSGEGAPIRSACVTIDSGQGIDDVIAYLDCRREIVAAIAAAHEHGERGDLARDRARQLAIITDDLRAGLHVGASSARAERRAAEDDHGSRQEGE